MLLWLLLETRSIPSIYTEIYCKEHAICRHIIKLVYIGKLIVSLLWYMNIVDTNEIHSPDLVGIQTIFICYGY